MYSTYSSATGGRLHANSLRSLKELVEGAVREQMTRGSLESVGDVEAEVQAQCAKLCRRIGDEVAKSACCMMAGGLIGDLMKLRQKRIMQHQLQQLTLTVVVVIRNVCCL